MAFVSVTRLRLLTFWTLTTWDQGDDMLVGMAKGKLTKSEMARRMNTPRAQLDRLLDPEGPSVTLATLQRAATAVGRKLHLELS